MGDCQNYNVKIIILHLISGYPKRDHNFDNHPYAEGSIGYMGFPRSRILTVLGVPIMRIYEDSILESTWGSPYLGQMPYLQEVVQKVDHGNKC